MIHGALSGVSDLDSRSCDLYRSASPFTVLRKNFCVHALQRDDFENRRGQDETFRKTASLKLLRRSSSRRTDVTRWFFHLRTSLPSSKQNSGSESLRFQSEVRTDVECTHSVIKARFIRSGEETSRELVFAP